MRSVRRVGQKLYLPKTDATTRYVQPSLGLRAAHMCCDFRWSSQGERGRQRRIGHCREAGARGVRTALTLVCSTAPSRNRH